MLKIRPAQLSDSRRLFEWRNDNETRKQFKNSNPVSWESHCSWLRNCLADKARRLYVAESDGEPVGTFRFDQAGDVFEISYTIAPEHRGRGLGVTMMRAALPLAGGPVVAEIKTANIASNRIAEAIGMKRAGRRDGFQIWRI